MPLTSAQREEMIHRYQEGPSKLRAALARVPDEARQWRPAPGKWSAHEVVCHAADSELNAAGRIRYLLAEDAPVISGYDQDQWAREFDYHSAPLEPALAVVEAVRANTAQLIRRLPESAWSKTGTHTESGPYSAEDWLRVYSEHLEKHSRQIDRNVESWKSSRTG
jgi:DinB superfamily